MEIIKNEISIDVRESNAISQFSKGLEMIFKECYTDNYTEIVILCIGTDRSTGDCLGPLVGHKLRLVKYKKVYVYGTLDEPVHAKNLCEIISNIKEEYINPFIIAIDACLGKVERIGKISIRKGPLRPGAGVNKDLPEVGHIHIIGVVNLSGFMEYLILQNTRLNIVMRMADTISSGIHFNIWRHMSEDGRFDDIFYDRIESKMDYNKYEEL